jgi:hypothetical protein
MPAPFAVLKLPEEERTDRAISFAASMISQGTYVGESIAVASRYYKVPYGSVQGGLAKRSGRSQRGKKKPTEIHTCRGKIEGPCTGKCTTKEWTGVQGLCSDGCTYTRCEKTATKRLSQKWGYRKTTQAYSCDNKACMEFVENIYGSDYSAGASYTWTNLRAPAKSKPTKTTKAEAPKSGSAVHLVTGSRARYDVGMKMNKRQ